MRPTHVVIRLDHLAHNLKQIRQRLRPATRIMAVVKANAYGHGAVAVSEAALKAGASHLAVSCLEEGAQLREAGITAPILVLGLSLPEQADWYCRYNLTATVSSAAALPALAAAAQRWRSQIQVMLTVDTGMGRIGVLPPALVALAKAVASCPELVRAGVFSHFATADEPGGSALADLQAERFFGTCAQLEAAGMASGLRTLSNSAAILQLPDTHADMVRAGIILYGLPPAPGLAPLMRGFKPVMEWYTKIVYLKEVDAGVPISYGATYTTTERTHIATLPVGYADGYSRRLSNQASVLIRGRRYPVVGRVCMDQLMINLGPQPPAFGIGEPVTLVGTSGAETITFTDLADLAGTINYELTCLITPRVSRLFQA